MNSWLGNRRRILLAALAVLVGLAAVALLARGLRPADPAGSSASTATAGLPPIVAAEGLVLPRRRADLAFGAGGQVAEVLVSEGQRVASGTVLARLDDTNAQNALAAAEAEQAAAEAKLAQLEAGPRGEDLAVAAAELARVRAGSRPEAIAATRAVLEKAEAALRLARAAYEPIQWLPDISRRPESLALQSATADYERAKAEHDAALAGATEEELRLAEARYRQVSARAGDPELALARAEVARAAAAVARARASLEDTVLRAPFAGVVGLLNLRPAERVGAGATVLVFGDLETLEVETLDLSEVDVARLRPGQRALLSSEAFPGQSFEARVRQVAPLAIDRHGERVFTVRLDLDETGREALRWGMTVFVDIEAEEAED